MKDERPKVSIGLAVFNGEKYLKEAIDSILSQTFTDFELIISDNASTDRTEEICWGYAEKDARIRYDRNSENIGGARNENKVFELSRGQYFRLIGHDDVFSPDLLEKSVKVLDNDRSIVSCYSTIVKIDENGQHLGILDLDIGNQDDPYERFREFASDKHNCETSYSLIRADILRKTELQLNYSDSDRTLLCELSLHGKFYRIPEPLFYLRYHEKKSTTVYPDVADRMAWFYPAIQDRAKNYALLVHFKQFSHYLRVIFRSPVSLSTRIQCCLYMIEWLNRKSRWKTIIRELMALTKKPRLV